MNVLVTGGLGFIGQHLLKRLLEQAHGVVVFDNLSAQIHGAIPQVAKLPDNRALKIVRGDVVDRQQLREVLKDVDAVVHLAAETGTGQSMYSVAHYNRVNTQGTAELLQLLVEGQHGVKRFVLASSRAVYGEGAYACPSCEEKCVQCPVPRERGALENGRWEPACPYCGSDLIAVPTSESVSLKPASIYAATKVAQEDLVRVMCEALRIPGAALRFQNVYGEGQSLKNPYTGIISIFSTKIRHGAELPLYEDGEESRDFVHVSDVVEAIVLSLESRREGFETYNVGAGTPTSVKVLAHELMTAFGREVPVRVTREFRVGDIRHCFADLTKIRSHLGFSPRVSLAAGLQRFVAWADAEPLPSDQLSSAEIELKARGLMR